MSPHPRCHRCAFRGPACLCGSLPSLTTAISVTIVRHVAERSKATGTARWVGLALANCRVLDYGMPPDPFDEADLGVEGAVLLFPDGPATPPVQLPRHLIVPDGTWPQARRMVQRLPALRTLERLSLPAPKSHHRLRHAPLKEGMSTLEAVAAALDLCGETAAAAGLRAVHQAVLDRAVAARGRLPGRAFR